MWKLPFTAVQVKKEATLCQFATQTASLNLNLSQRRMQTPCRPLLPEQQRINPGLHSNFFSISFFKKLTIMKGPVTRRATCMCYVLYIQETIMFNPTWIVCTWSAKRFYWKPFEYLLFTGLLFWTLCCLWLHKMKQWEKRTETSSNVLHSDFVVAFIFLRGKTWMWEQK